MYTSKSPSKRTNKSNSRLHVEHSPRKTNPTHTLLHQDKLKVYIKFRPHLPENNHHIKYLNQKQIEIEKSVEKKIYKFDHVFHHHIPNRDVYEIGCQDVIEDVLRKGGNGLVFVYGHTGTGKTHTMGLLGELNTKSEGIVPDSLRYIFGSGVKNMSLSFSEIYMDEVYDMLDFEMEKKLNIREHKQTKEPYIQNEIHIRVKSLQESFQVINMGLEKRKIAQQKINKRSSRGHGIITFNINESGKNCKLCFVDLAGSQRIKESQSIGKTFNQAIHINASLSALETLLMNISQKSVRMYRSNKLTRLLQPFMESGKIKLFVTSNYENIQPIEFGKRCKGIKFMEKEGQKSVQKKKEGEGKGEKEDGKGKKNLLYCISNLIGIVCKINENISELLEDLSVQSSFSLAESFQIKNQRLEEEINLKISKLEGIEERILEKELKLQLSPQELITYVDSPSQFMKKIHDVGFNIFQSIKKMFNLAEYRNLYKKQIFTTELKSSILQNKNKQFQTVINHLLKSHSHQNQVKLTKELKDLGVEIKVGKEGSGLKKRSKKQNSSFVRERQDIENSPMNRSQRKSLIYIED